MQSLQSFVKKNYSPTGEVHKRVYLFPDIPDNLLRKITRPYAFTMTKDEVPLLIVDTLPRTFWQHLKTGTTIFGGVCGLLITSRAIYDGSDWKSSMYAFGHDDYRSIPLDSICTVTTEKSFNAAPVAVTVNGIPLFGEHPHVYDGLEDKDFLSWLATFIRELVHKIRHDRKPSAKDIVDSYRGFLGQAEEKRLTFNRCFYYPNIPPELINSVQSSFAKPENSEEQVLFIYKDDNNNKAGIVITDSHIYSRRAGHDFFMKWDLSAIKSIWIGITPYDQFARCLNVVIDNRRVWGWPDKTENKYTVDPIWGSVCGLASMIYQIARILKAPCAPPPMSEAIDIFHQRIDISEYEKKAMIKLS